MPAVAVVAGLTKRRTAPDVHQPWPQTRGGFDRVPAGRETRTGGWRYCSGGVNDRLADNYAATKRQGFGGWQDRAFVKGRRKGGEWGAGYVPAVAVVAGLTKRRTAPDVHQPWPQTRGGFDRAPAGRETRTGGWRYCSGGVNDQQVDNYAATKRQGFGCWQDRAFVKGRRKGGEWGAGYVPAAAVVAGLTKRRTAAASNSGRVRPGAGRQGNPDGGLAVLFRGA